MGRFEDYLEALFEELPYLNAKVRKKTPFWNALPLKSAAIDSFSLAADDPDIFLNSEENAYNN
jgi:hypothetical protein